LTVLVETDSSGDQGGVRGALPGLALEQARRWVQQEPQQRTLGFGQVERLLQGAPGGGWVAQRVPRDRLELERLNQPGPPAHGGGFIQHRRERHGRRVRVVLSEPQQCPHRRGQRARRGQVPCQAADRAAAAEPGRIAEPSARRWLP
jgi:hypothetical protein